MEEGKNTRTRSSWIAVGDRDGGLTNWDKMKKIILSVLIALFSINTAFADTKNFYPEVLKKVSKHQGRNIRPYLNASYHVARMFRGWPSPDFYQRVTISIGYGGKESAFEPDYVHHNIPGKPYPGLKGLRVKRFSVDYSWAGLNQDAVIPTYTVAKAIQLGHNISRAELHRLGLRSDLMDKLRPILKIPKNMVLYEIDTSTAIDARRQYDIQKNAGVPPKQIKISIDYLEDTQDKIDSVLIYRLIEEFERSLRSWPWQSYDSEAYYICQNILNQP